MSWAIWTACVIAAWALVSLSTAPITRPRRPQSVRPVRRILYILNKMWQTVCWPTKNSLKQRFQGQFYQIAHDAENTEVSRHFNGNGHHGIKDVGMHILDFVHQTITKSSTIDIRLGLKFDWIHRLHYLIPKGLNSLDGSN